MKTIVITGASGLVSTQLIYEYLLNDHFKLILISTHPNELKEQFTGHENVTCLSLDDFTSGKYDKISIDLIIHTAFARTGKGNDYVKSLDFLHTLLEYVKSNSVRSFINISSQSVYGDASIPLWKETNSLGPTYMYAMAKYASEVIVKTALEDTDVNWTNIRLSSVCENARFMKVFVENIIQGKPITVQGGSQICSFIDVRDVASGLFSMINHSDNHFEKVYNLGNGLQYSILQIAELCKKIGKEKYGFDAVINVVPSDLTQNVGMNPEKFISQFEWHPLHDMESMITSLFEMLINPNGGGYPKSFKIKYK